MSAACTAAQRTVLVTGATGYIGGWLVNTLLVRHDVEKIFRFRQTKLRGLFA